LTNSLTKSALSRNSSLPGINVKAAAGTEDINNRAHADSLTVEIVDDVEGKKVFRKRRKGTHHVFVEVLEVLCGNTDAAAGNDEGGEGDEGDKEKAAQQQPTTHSRSSSYPMGSRGSVVDVEKKAGQTKFVYSCKVYYDGVLAPWALSEEEEDNVHRSSVVERAKSFSVHANNSSKFSIKESAPRPGGTEHLIEVSQTASDIGVRYLEVYVNRIRKSGTSGEKVGGLRVELGGLRQDVPRECWYVLTEGPEQGKVRIRLTYTSDLPSKAETETGERLLVDTPPLLNDTISADDRNDYFWCCEAGANAGKRNALRAPNPSCEYVEEIIDDICLMGTDSRVNGNPYNVLVQGALILSTHRFLFVPHRAAYRKSSRSELGSDIIRSRSYSEQQADGSKATIHIPLGWIAEVSTCDAIELGEHIWKGTLLKIRCKIPGVYYFHMGKKAIGNRLVHGGGCCGNLFRRNRTQEEVSLEELTYSPEVIVDNLLSTFQWLLVEEDALLRGEPLVVEVESDDLLRAVDDILSQETVPGGDFKHSSLSSGRLSLVLDMEEEEEEEEEEEGDGGARAERERLEKERLEKERLEKERLEKEQLEKEEVEAETRLFTLEEEHKRQGYLSHGWRLVTQKEYHICSTYPVEFVVPESISDSEVEAVALYRSRGRIPAMIWRHPLTGAVLSRCAQPKSGITGSVSPADQKMLNAFKDCNASMLLSAVRTKSKSRSNVFGKKSSRSSIARMKSEETSFSTTESMFGSPGTTKVKKKALQSSSRRASMPTNTGQVELSTELSDLSIQRKKKPGVAKLTHHGVTSISSPRSMSPSTNDAVYSGLAEDEKLHIMDLRPRMNAVANKMMGKGTENLANYGKGFSFLYHNIPNIHVMRNSLQKLVWFGYNGDWQSGIYESKWLDYTSMILNASLYAVNKLESGVSCLIHCSDGWDRTPQVGATAMILLDPFYRTIKGFVFLVQSQWCDFGHMFEKRVRFVGSRDHSPVFLQFLDCVYQLVRQCPKDFEFTSSLLVFMMEHAYSNWFRTFAGNSNKVRNEQFKTAICMFDCIMANKTLFKNGTYHGDATKRLDVLSIKTSPESIKLWVSLYGRPIRFARNFSRRAKSPRFVTRLLHRKTMAQMLPFVMKGIRPPSRIKRTSLFLGGHLNIKKFSHNSHHHTRGRTSSLGIRIRSRGHSRTSHTPENQMALNTRVESNEESVFTNERNGSRSRPCVVM
jgi:hypothetical protein